MPQYRTQDLMRAAYKAMEAGDEDTARSLFTAARDQSLAEAETTERGMYTIPSAVRQTLQGPSFGFADEAEAALRAPFSDQSYGEIHEDLAKTREAYQAAHPKAAIAQEMLGGLAGGAGAMGVAGRYAPGAVRAATRAYESVPSIMAPAGAGAVAGGLYGAGTADPGERLEGAGVGAGFGAVAGAGGQYLINKIVAPLAARLGRNLMSTERGDAKRLILRALEDSGMTPEDALNELQTRGPDALLADLSPALRQLGIEATSIPGSSARNVAEEALRGRAERQQNVIWDYANRLMGNPPGKKLTLDLVNANQKRVAAPLYKEAYETQIPVLPELQNFLEIPDIKKAYKAGRRLAQLERKGPVVGRAWDEKAQDFIEYPSMMEWDYIQRGLRARAEAARIKQPSLSRSLHQARNELLEVLDGINPAFGEARQTYAQHEALKDAMNAGEKFLKEDEELLEDMLRGMTQSERSAYMIGVAKTLRREIMGMGENRNVALNKMFNVPLYREKLASVIGPERAENILSMAQDLGEQSLTMQKTLNRSPTADILAGQKQLGAPTSMYDLMSHATNSLLGGPELSVKNADYIGRMLYGRPPSPSALQPILGGSLSLPPRLGEATPLFYGLLGAQTGNYLGAK